MKAVKVRKFTFKSKSSDRVYTVRVLSARKATCNCKGWIYSIYHKGRRTCSHSVLALAKAAK